MPPRIRCGPGSPYLLSSSGFVADEPVAGLDTAHLVSLEPVRRLARIDVTPADFPFGNRIRYYRDREPIWVSLLLAGQGPPRTRQAPKRASDES